MATIRALKSSVLGGPVQRLLSAAALGCALVTATTAPAFAQATLKTIKDRGEVRCGVSEGLPGFSMKNERDIWTGFDVDLCRALAAAIFDSPSKVAFTPLSTERRFAALASGAIDVLSRNTSWTLAHEAGLGFQFAAVTYYDSQGFMVQKSRGALSALDLQGATICVQNATTTELNIADYFRARKIDYLQLTLPTAAEVVKAYGDGRCNVITSDVSQLYAERLLLKAPDEHVILREVIAKEPLGPVVREGDDRWLNVVKWTHYAMLNAEELGITQKTVGEVTASESAKVKRLLGTYAALGSALGLSDDWAARIIRHVGNYGESFERNLGADSKLTIPRGLNRLWTDGGIQYAPPIR